MDNTRNANTAGAKGAEKRIRRRLDVRGRVQGVGFRPFVYRLASELRLGGLVGNDARGAFVEVEGPSGAVDRFTGRLRSELPPLAKIESMAAGDLTPKNEPGFRIDRSRDGGRAEARITPDVATCDDCLSELNDPSDRRYRYPFINCTNCGPRYSIIRAVPYDRANTTMATFEMCPTCRSEYEEPSDRRFHAQPDACEICGPHLSFVKGDGAKMEGDAIKLCAEMLIEGGLVAIKGLGGFHLACRADSDEAVLRLRRRKAREAKPLAVMVGSEERARELAILDEASTAALVSPIRPIVLAPRRPDAPVSEHVAPSSPCLGIMLPYTPIHHLLFAEGIPACVMTSGNPSAEPLCGDNDEALRRLGEIADAFLMHDRDIERRVDDSIVVAMTRPGEDGPAHYTLPIRRARGYVPDPIYVPVESAVSILAVGGQLKSALCLLRGDTAVMSEHLGELDNPSAYRNFVETVERFESLLEVKPELCAFDLHPDYAATRYARGLSVPLEGVQHHHAHVVSCMAENGLTGKVVGIACDGTGYGTDGRIWGCEVLVCDEASFERAGHLRYYPLIGGDSAALETWRPAAGLLRETFGDGWSDLGAMRRVDAEKLRVAERRLSGEARLVETSSLGRLFDAAAFLLGLCDRNLFEAQAARALESAASAVENADPLPYELSRGDDGEIVLDVREMIRELVASAGDGGNVQSLARAFHETVAAMLAEAAARAAKRENLRKVVLSGGCFANRLLLGSLWRRLRQNGLDVFVHQNVPTGDGGIALGQALVAAARIRRR